MQRYNRIRVVLAEKDLMNKDLANALDINPATVSKWCANMVQPRIPMLYDIAKALDVEIYDLLRPREEVEE